MSGTKVLLQKNCFSMIYDLMFTKTDAPNTIIPNSLAVRPVMEPYIVYHNTPSLGQHLWIPYVPPIASYLCIISLSTG